ncbi:hypothetical protein ABK040_006770 [Willaertia magna]
MASEDNSKITSGKTTWVRFKDVYFYAEGYKTDPNKIWKEIVDNNTKKIYYYNQKIKKSLWKLPDYVTEDENIKQSNEISSPSSISSPTTPPSNKTLIESPNTTPNTISPTNNLTPTSNSNNSNNSTNGSIPEKRTSIDLNSPIEKTEKVTTREENKRLSLARTFAFFRDDKKDMENNKSKTIFVDNSKSHTNKSNEDDFSNFDAVNLNRIQETKVKNPMILQKGSEIDSESISPSEMKLSFIGKTLSRGTLSMDKFSLNKKELTNERGELEDLVEDDLFNIPGKGETRVLSAIRVFHYMGPKTKKERILVLARDYVGSFCLFFANQNTKTRKIGPILSAIPLLDYYQIDEIESNKENSKFTLAIDGNDVMLLTHVILRDKLRQALDTAFQEVKNRKGKELQTYRLCCTEFANSYLRRKEEGAASVRRILESNPNEKIAEEDIMKNLDTETFISREYDKAFKTLRMSLRNQYERDCALQEILSFMSVGLKKLGKSKINTCVSILETIMKCPNVSERLDLRNDFLLVMKNLEDTKLVDNDTIKNLIELGENTFKAIEEWEGRGKLPNVPFGDVYRCDRKKQSNETQTEKLMRESIFQKRVPSGVYLCTLFYTKYGDVLCDQNENLPCVRLDKLLYHTESKKNLNHPDWQWLLRYGHSNFHHAMYEMSSGNTNFSDSIFKGEFVRGYNELYRIMGTDLGIILDKCVIMKGHKVLYYLFIKEIDIEKFDIPLAYKWEYLIDFEIKHFQKYEKIDDNFVIDKLESHYNGSRWVFSAINFHRAITKPLSEGIWIGYFKFRTSEQGISLVVDDRRRNMIPVVKVTPEYDLSLIKSIFEKREQIEKNEFKVEGITCDTPDFKCNTLDKQLYKAILKLKNTIGKDDLGNLYFQEAIDVNVEKRNTKLIVFVDYTEDNTEEKLNKRFLWREVKTFEYLFHNQYNHQLFIQYINLLRNGIDVENEFINDTRLTCDEFIRYKTTKEKKIRDFIRLDESWVVMCWPLRILIWHLSLLQGNPNNFNQIIQQFSSVVQDQGSLINKFKKASKIDYLGYLNELFKESDNQENEAKREKEISLLREKKMKEEDEEDIEKIICVVYDVDVNIEDIRDIDNLLLEPTKDEIANAILEEEIEKALVDHIDKLEVIVIKEVLDDIITVIETTSDIVDLTVFQSKKEQATNILLEERAIYQHSIIDIGDENEKLINMTENKKKNIYETFESNSDDKRTYNDHIRHMLSLFNDSLIDARKMLEVIRSSQEMIELIEYMFQYERTLKQQETLLKTIEDINNFVPQSKPQWIRLHDFEEDSSGLKTESELKFQEDEERIKKLLEEERMKELTNTKAQRKRMKQFINNSIVKYQKFSLPPNETKERDNNTTPAIEKKPRLRYSPSLSSLNLSSPKLKEKTKPVTPNNTERPQSETKVNEPVLQRARSSNMKISYLSNLGSIDLFKKRKF